MEVGGSALYRSLGSVKARSGDRTLENTTYECDLVLANPACPIHLIGYTSRTVRI